MASRFIRILLRVAWISTGIAALFAVILIGLAAVIISFQGSKEMRTTLLMVAEASALYAAGRSHAGGSVRSAVYYMTSDVMSCKIEVVKFICSSIMNK